MKKFFQLYFTSAYVIMKQQERGEGFLYVDKTAYIYRLAKENVPYFLSRPRRFGKSLLISAMKYYWEGRKDLFEGLAIEKLEAEAGEDAWKAHPVFLFDFNGANYQAEGALEKSLDTQLKRFEMVYGYDEQFSEIGERFQNLLIRAEQKYGKRSVVLIDEYDKPLLDTVDDQELQEHNRAVLKGFFSTLKSFDNYIQFIFITGVTKFHKVSIFSDLNQLTDISLDSSYAGICGITEEELRQNFCDRIAALAEAQEMTVEECLAKLKKTYDGYRFHPSSQGVYNPFSLLTAFFRKEFGSYWFETGTPTFLVRKLKAERFDVRRFTDRTIYAKESTLKDYTGDNLEPVPLLYQTGYLTIAGYEKNRSRYTLCFPNEEVKYGFLESLLPAYVPKATETYGLDIFTLDDYVENGEIDGIRDVLTALFAGITYTLESDPFEHYFQAVIYLVFTLLGRYVQCEMHTFTGRIDCKVGTRSFLYLFEFKRDVTAKEALAQIDSKEYALPFAADARKLYKTLPFAADARKLYKIGVSFDSKERKLVGWEVGE